MASQEKRSYRTARQKTHRKDPIEEALKLNNITTEDGAILHLGIGLHYAYAPPGAAYKLPYLKMGKELWQAIQYELRGLFCDRTRKKPKPWVEELIAGDARTLAVAVMTVLVSSYDMALSIAVPATALIIKRQLSKLCTTPVPRPERGVKEILLAKQESFKAKRIQKR